MIYGKLMNDQDNKLLCDVGKCVIYSHNNWQRETVTSQLEKKEDQEKKEQKEQIKHKDQTEKPEIEQEEANQYQQET